jgi:hypothetical protein
MTAAQRGLTVILYINRYLKSVSPGIEEYVGYADF